MKENYEAIKAKIEEVASGAKDAGIGVKIIALQTLGPSIAGLSMTIALERLAGNLTREEAEKLEEQRKKAITTLG